MPYFHASRNVYPFNHVIRVPEGAIAHAYQLSLELGMKWREDALEGGRNERASSRQNAVYAANTVCNAARFLVAQPDPQDRPVRGYEVVVAQQIPSPMVLIGYIDAQGPDFAFLPACVEEYWAPTRAWRFLEYVCPSLIVTAELGVIADADMWIAGEDYEHDRQLARQLWGPIPLPIQASQTRRPA